MPNGTNKNAFFISTLAPEADLQHKELEKFVPFSEARVFRTDKGFIVKDNDDDTWCKLIPYDDLDKVKTEVAYRTLNPIQINAMKTMPLPIMTEISKNTLDEIETDFEQVCKQSNYELLEHNTIHISSLWATDDSNQHNARTLNSPNQQDLTLTREDVLQQHFGTLRPYIEDYTNNTYEVEENHTTHLPALTNSYQVSVSNKFGPLSYQNSVLDNDPLEEEDLDDSSSNDHHSNNIFPSDLLPNLVKAHLSTNRMGTPVNQKQTHQKREAEQQETSDIDQINTNQNENLEPEESLEDLDEWTMLKNSIPPGFILNTSITLILLIVIFMGFIIQIPMALLIGVFSFLYHYGPKTFRGICDIFIKFMDTYFDNRERRKKFTNKNGQSQRAVVNLSKLNLITSKKQTKTIKMDPLEGLSINKPEGSVASNKKIKRTYHIEPAKISEARIVKTVDDRHFFTVKFFEHITRLALYDPGACSCTISPKFLEELQATGHVPIEGADFNIQGVIRKASKKADKIAYLDFQLETGHWLKNVPFVVFDTGNDILIGNNLIRAHRWANCWKNDNFYIDLGNNQPLIPTYLNKSQPDKEITAISINEITIYPSETTTIDLSIPCMGSKMLSHFKHRDLLAEPLFVSEEDDFLEFYPTLSRMRKNELNIAVRNKGTMPFKITSGTELAKVSALERGAKPLEIQQLHDAKKTYHSIPRIHTRDCHCQIEKRLVKDDEKEELAVRIAISDQLGHTSIGQLIVPEKGELLKPGIHLKRDDNGRPTTLLLVTDEEGSLAHIDRIMIKRAHQQLKECLKKKQVPLFFFMDPLHTVAFTTRFVINDLFKELKFSFYPVRSTGHQECVRPALNMNNPELFAGINKTKIHIQNGPIRPLESSLMREHGTPLIKIPFQDAFLFMFRLGHTLNCHLHLPVTGKDGKRLSEEKRNNILTSFLSELRFLRIPTNTEITTDGYNSSSGAPISEEYIKELVYQVFRRLPPFLEPASVTSWPSRQSEEHPLPVDVISSGCHCALCLTPDYDGKPLETTIFKGDINDLICSAPFPSRSAYSTSSRSSKVSSELQIAIASICEIGEDFDTDQPLDFMNLCDEDDMQAFLNTHPGTEPDEEDTSKLPPPQTSNPELFKGFDMEGIPDQFRPGDWKTTDIMDRLQGVTEKIKKAFGELLDKHVNVISYHASDCRPVLLHGKPAIVDISLTTDEPIFMKPYMVSGAAVDALDRKLDELIEKNEIHPIESKYNVAIILTHHNSSQKHVDGTDKKVRLVLDMRWVNGVMKDKNLHSYLVKKIELLFMAIHGSKVMTSFDITKAYRALVASFKLQQICAFRTPSSRKYPHVTWAFRSTCDGLANLPGYYSYLMQEALSKEAKQFTIAHIDDILIFSKTDEEHLQHIDTVLTDLGKCNFMVSAKKMQPFQRQINFLGHMLDGEKKWIPDERRSYFDLLEPPQTKKQLQSLLGIANYMANFIDSYAMIVGPLYDALKGKSDKAQIVFNDIQKKAFYELKKRISQAPRLGLLDTSRTIYMECDASLVGTGSVVYHEKQENGKTVREIIRYGSRRFSLTESLNHTSLEKEAMAILIGVKQHMSFLEACPEAVIKTDLKSLITLLSCYNNPESVRMARMSHRLYSLPFKWSLIHIPGVDLPLADALSRLYPAYTCLYTDRHLRYPDLKRDNIMMPPEWRNKPDLQLTTADLLEAMRQQIVFIEKSSTNVKEKRLKALIQEVSIQYEELSESREQLATELEEDLLRCRDKIQQEKAQKQALKMAALTAVSPRTLVTPEFLTERQNLNPQMHNIITMLRTMPRDKIPSKILKRFRLLNDTILVTRKNMRNPFNHPGNLRIVCDANMTIHILSLIHVMSGHFGMNTLNHAFTNTYKCIEKSTQGFVKLICSACRSCRFHRQTNKKVVPWGRIPFPNAPNDTWMIDFMVFKQEQTFNGRKIAAAFNIVDLYSNLFISIPVKNQKAQTVIECLKFIFAQFNVPRKIVSDNAKALCRNPAVVHFLKINNVKQIATTTAHNSQGNKVERMHKTFRDTLKLVQETFMREKPFDMYYSVVQMMNSRPLSLSLHPHIKNICKDLGQEPGVITPFALHFGLPLTKHPLIPLENTLEPESRGAFRAKWQHIITEYDKQLQKELEERQEQFKGRIIEEGDLVLIKNMVAHKEQLRFYKEIFEVVKIQKARYFCAPLFSKGAIMEVNGNNLKPYAYSELFDQLPEDVRLLMGENLSPEELKRQAEQDPSSLPQDLHTWQQWKTPTTMSLRNRISPQDRQSQPALSVHTDSDNLSETSDSSSDIFNIPDDVSDFKSEASSLLNRSGVSQPKTTPQGIISTPYTLPSLDKANNPSAANQQELHPNITIRRKKPTTLSNTLTDYAVTLEDIENSMKQKLIKQGRKTNLLTDLFTETPQDEPTIKLPSPIKPTIVHPSEENLKNKTPSTPLLKQDKTEIMAKPTPTPLKQDYQQTPPTPDNTSISTDISTPPVITINPPTCKNTDIMTKTLSPPLITVTQATPQKDDSPIKLDKPPLIMPHILKRENRENTQNTPVPPSTPIKNTPQKHNLPPVTPPARNTIVHQNTPYTPFATHTPAPVTPQNTDTSPPKAVTPSTPRAIDSPSTLQRLFDSTKHKLARSRSKTPDSSDKFSKPRTSFISDRLRSRQQKPFKFLNSSSNK